MTVVVGYIPDKFGDAALAEGIEEARRRRTRLLVVNATRGDALIDRRYLGQEGLADLEERLAGIEVEHEVRQAMGADIAEEMIRVVREVDAQVLVIGRPPRCRTRARAPRRGCGAGRPRRAARSPVR